MTVIVLVMMKMKRMRMYGVPIGFDEVMFCCRDPVTSPVESVLHPLEVIDNPPDVHHLHVAHLNCFDASDLIKIIIF